MSPFERELADELEGLRAEGLQRQLRKVSCAQGTRLELEGQIVLNFSSNDYLGLAAHPAVKEAACEASQTYGAGAGASRMLCGSLAPFHELEESLAAFKGTEASLTFSTGYSAALGTIGALLTKDDALIVDKLVHACVVDASRLCGAQLRIFKHNDLEDLESKLRWAANLPKTTGKSRNVPRILVVTESVFSMDGDLAPLREIVELKERYGAWLMLDEAHGTGLFGENRRGLAEAYELGDRVEIQMGTLSKALGASGGFICGRRALIELLIHRARSFIFSTAPVPAAAGAAIAALNIVRSAAGESLRQRLWQQVDGAKNAAICAGWSLPPVQSAILPLHVGAETAAVTLAVQLRERGLFIPAIRYPSVARGEARLRLTVSAAHTTADIQQLGAALSGLQPRS